MENRPKTAFVESFLKKHCPSIRPKERQSALEEIKYQALILKEAKNKKFRVKKTKRKKLSHKEKKKLKVYDLPKDNLKSVLALLLAAIFLHIHVYVPVGYFLQVHNIFTHARSVAQLHSEASGFLQVGLQNRTMLNMHV